MVAANTEATEPRVPFGKVVVITSQWLGWPLWNICVKNDHGHVPLVISTSRSFPHSRLITGFVARLTRRVSLVEQELSILPEHLSSPPFLVGSCYSIFGFIRMFCRSLFVLLSFLFWPLCCRLFCDIRILITPLISSNSSSRYHLSSKNWYVSNLSTGH